METDNTKTEKRKVEKTITINAPRSEVWKAITDAEELTNWFPLQANVNPGKGGKIKLYWDDRYKWEFNIDEWEEEKYLSVSYKMDTGHTIKDLDKKGGDNYVHSSPHVLAVDYYLEGDENKTKLRLVHSGFGHGNNWDEWYDGVRRGWSQELKSLKFYLENHPGEKRNVSWSLVHPRDSVEEVWNKIWSKEGFEIISSEKLSEGNRYKIKTPDGKIYEGAILFYNPPWDFVGTVESLNNAFLRIKQDDIGGNHEMDIFLCSYGIPDKAKEFKKYWDQKLNTIIN